MSGLLVMTGLLDSARVYALGVVRGLLAATGVGIAWGLLSLLSLTVSYDGDSVSRAFLYMGYTVLVASVFFTTVTTTYAVLSRRGPRFVLELLRASSGALGSRLFWIIFVTYAAITVAFMADQDAFERNRAIQVGLITIVITMAYGGAYRAYRLYGTMSMRERDEYLIDRQSTGLITRTIRISTTMNKVGTKLGLLAGLISGVGCWLCYLIVFPQVGAFLACVAACVGLALVHTAWLTVVLAWDTYRPIGTKGRLVSVPTIQRELDSLRSRDGKVVVKDSRAKNNQSRKGSAGTRKGSQRAR